MEHKVCEGCQWNHYPECFGTKMGDGSYMNIETLRIGFECGQKYKNIMMDFSFKKKSSEQLKIEELEAKLNEMDLKIKDLEKR